MIPSPPPRRPTQVVKVGDVAIGGDNPISVQSMTNTDTRDAEATVTQIRRLALAGCEIVRVAVPDETAAARLPEILDRSPIPVIADIHFDYRLALAAIAAGVHGARINPGNIGGDDHVRAVAEAAGAAGIPIRVGVNSGSLSARDKAAARKGGRAAGAANAEALVEKAISECDRLERFGFHRIKVSLKASDVPTTVAAYRLFADRRDYPLHLGVTEAGTFFRAAIKSATALGALLLDGVGDTLRVSVTGDPVEEIRVANAILEAVGVRQARPDIVSCPTCGRTEVDLAGAVRLIEERIENEKRAGFVFRPSKIAVMGCAVNGPGEARDADLGIAGGKGHFVLFRRGKTLGAYPEAEALEKFFDLLRELGEER